MKIMIMIQTLIIILLLVVLCMYVYIYTSVCVRLCGGPRFWCAFREAAAESFGTG